MGQFFCLEKQLLQTSSSAIPVLLHRTEQYGSVCASYLPRISSKAVLLSHVFFMLCCLHMKKTILLSLIFALFAIPVSVQASLGQDLAGRILLQVEEHGEAWYIHPTQYTRHYLKDGEAAYTVMRFFSLGISDADLALIPSVADTTEMNTSSSICASNTLANRLKGNILLQVEQNGEAWYIDVEKCRRIYLRDGQAAYDVMRFLGLGITNTDLARIDIAEESNTPVENDQQPSEEVNKEDHTQTVNVNGQSFVVDLVKIDLADPSLSVITDAVEDGDCPHDCPVQSLEAYVKAHNGFAGIHGSYFCPEDYSACSNQKNYFFAPIFDSIERELINESQLVYPTTGSLWVFDSNNDVHFIPSTQDFLSVRDFEEKNGITIDAAISNIPPLIVNGQNVVSSQQLDDKQRNTKSSRGGIAVKGDELYLLIAQSATVPELAGIMESLGMEQGMNLDGGGSSALYYEGQYLVGPGRNIPNAIVFTRNQ